MGQVQPDPGQLRANSSQVQPDPGQLRANSSRVQADSGQLQAMTSPLKPDTSQVGVRRSLLRPDPGQIRPPLPAAPRSLYSPPPKSPTKDTHPRFGVCGRRSERPEVATRSGDVLQYVEHHSCEIGPRSSLLHAPAQKDAEELYRRFDHRPQGPRARCTSSRKSSTTPPTRQWPASAARSPSPCTPTAR